MKAEFRMAGALAGLLLFFGGCGTPKEISFQGNGQTETSFSTDSYRTVLASYVDGQGRVNYKFLKAHRTDLDAYGASLARLTRATYEGWTEQEKIAFWINAYNALTLAAIVEHYPIETGSIVASLRFPQNSIRQISGVWDELSFQVLGQKMTLDHMEHKILRKEFQEPRIHMALVCAAIGCPALRNEPYQGKELSRQLGDQTRRFLADSSKFRIDRAAGKVFLSSIFKWFGSDFVPGHGTSDSFKDHGDASRAVLNFITPYLSDKDRAFLTSRKVEIEYMDYDWTLNEQAQK